MPRYIGKEMSRVDGVAKVTGKRASEATFREAADAAMKDARPLEHNAYKVELGRRAIVRALARAGGM